MDFNEIDKALTELEQGETETTNQTPDILDNYEICETLAKSIEIDPDKALTELQPLICYREQPDSGQGVGMIYRGTLSLITGQKGSRKSTFAASLCKILLNGELTATENPATLTATTQGLKVALIDTEQHENRLQKMFRYICRDYTGETPVNDVFRAYSARGQSTNNIYRLIKTIAATFKPDVLVIDVISHLVNDVNDQKTTKFAVDFINRIMAVYGCAIVGVIHQNQSKETTENDRPTGAAGTKFLQAAEITLSVVRVQPKSVYVVNISKGANSNPDTDKGKEKALNEHPFSYAHFVEFRDKPPRFPDIAITHRGSGYDVNLCPLDIVKGGKRGETPLFRFIAPCDETKAPDSITGSPHRETPKNSH